MTLRETKTIYELLRASWDSIDIDVNDVDAWITDFLLRTAIQSHICDIAELIKDLAVEDFEAIPDRSSFNDWIEIRQFVKNTRNLLTHELHEKWILDSYIGDILERYELIPTSDCWMVKLKVPTLEE